MSIKSLMICIILFYLLFNFRKYLFYCIGKTVSGDYISNPVYNKSNSSLEINRPQQGICPARRFYRILAICVSQLCNYIVL